MYNSYLVYMYMYSELTELYKLNYKLICHHQDTSESQIVKTLSDLLSAKY